MSTNFHSMYCNINEQQNSRKILQAKQSFRLNLFHYESDHFSNFRKKMTMHSKTF